MNLVIFASIEFGGLLLPLCGLLAFLFWIWMLVDCIKYETSDSTKITWVLELVFTGIVGAPIYYFVRRRQRRRVAQFDSASPIYQPWDKSKRIR
jgi:prolipoprotein diacylglyceryltransferase